MFNNKIFQVANWQGHNFEGENFCENTNFLTVISHENRKIYLHGANLKGAIFKYLNLSSKVEFQGANLRKANFQSAILRGVQFQGTDLKDATLQYADLHESSFTGAKLHGANLKGCKDSHTADWSQAEYDLKTQFPDDFNPDEHGLIQTRRRGESVTAKSGEQSRDEDEIDIKINDALSKIITSIRKRQGQEKFRNALITYYEGRCAISGCEVTGVLEAAHVEPYSLSKNNNPNNGILLRADLHTLFDLNLIVIHPYSKRLEIKPTLLLNEDYKKFNGITLPSYQDKIWSPDDYYLKWRQDNYEKYIGQFLR
ncbi:pentapeptide repeat-containing protein [Nostoc linckia FACHB-104]|nr:pentapeptide repeat-containing protein [Nostoc linckia FACHB-104]